MQVNKSEDERNIYFLDDKLQLFSFRITVPGESLSYLGMKKIDFVGLKRTSMRRSRNLEEGNVGIFSRDKSSPESNLNLSEKWNSSLRITNEDAKDNSNSNDSESLLKLLMWRD